MKGTNKKKMNIHDIGKPWDNPQERAYERRLMLIGWIASGIGLAFFIWFFCWATSAPAQVGWDGYGARRGGIDGGSTITINTDAIRDFSRGYRDYVFSRDGLITLLDAMNNRDPYGANAAARAIEHSGVPMDSGGRDVLYGMPGTFTSFAGGPLGGGTKCAQPISQY